MAYFPTQQDIDILYQSATNLYINIDLLSMDLTVINQQDNISVMDLIPIDNLQGELITDTFTIDAESDIRRTFNLTMFVKDSSFLVSPDSKIWLDKLIQIKVGLQHQRTKEIIYYPMGTFLFDEAGYKYDTTTKTLTLTCVDLMANFTGLRNGQVAGLSTEIFVDKEIRQVMIDTLVQYGHYNEYRIDSRPALNSDGSPQIDNNGNYVEATIPHDLKFNAGATVYEILSKVNELQAGWEMFFDTNNMFINQKIPTTYGDECVLDWQTLESLIISESINTKFSEVKNSTRVWGKCLDADRFADNITHTTITEGNVNYIQYEGTLEKLIPEDSNSIPIGTTIAFTPDVTNSLPPYLQITDHDANFVGSYPIVDSGDNPIEVGTLQGDDGADEGRMYVVRYRGEKFYFQGQSQIVAVVKEYSQAPWTEGQESTWKAQDKIYENTNNIKWIINSDSPFAIDKIGEIRQVLEGGDFEMIYTDEDAMMRAEYENWRSMRLNYELNLRMRPILWLDVNQKIQYKSKVTGEIEEYIIKSIDGSSMSGEMNVKAIKFYPLYPFVVQV